MLLALAVLQEEAPPPLIDVDGTVVVQFVLFLIMLFVLSKVLFGPYLKLRADRARGIEGARHEADALSTRADAMVADYDAKLAAARAKSGDQRAQLRSEAAVRERELVGAARDQAHKAIDAARATVTTQAAAAKKGLEAQAGVLARQMARKLLGREVA